MASGGWGGGSNPSFLICVFPKSPRDREMLVIDPEPTCGGTFLRMKGLGGGLLLTYYYHDLMVALNNSG